MFSNLSESSISLATVTPSLVIRGAPKLLSRTTLRPLGPSVTLTVSFSTWTPLSIRLRASVENLTSLAAMLVSLSCWAGALRRLWRWRGGRLDDAHDVAFLHDQQVLAVELDLGAGPLAEQDPFADRDAQGDQVALVVARTRAHSHNLALHGLFLGGVG